ncbi:MBL fold metallo-hydrolase [Eubacteriales bacterium OttesenSCG-928-A19]|nr:MBL fold metallo-hydrolase [Eubacteriales bacterium OttesenSCG-928-A19]
MPRLLYQGHASFRLVSDKGVVIYVDPYAGEGYDLPADIVLITHHHPHHSALERVICRAKTRVITDVEAQVNGIYNTFRIRRVGIRAVPATNDHHDPRETVGYIITVDGVRIYAAGDTSETEAMGDMLWMKLDYALLPVDGVHNMNATNASICAARIGARYSIPYHTKPGELFNRDIARRFDIPSRLILEPGDEIDLESHS